jgi:homocysteine S-methyltransferase
MLFNKQQIYILAGATGTELQRRGVKTELPLWSAVALWDNPKILTDIYIDYIHAGADIITTNTFRTQKWTLKKAGKESEWEKINKSAVDIAKDAIKKTNKKVLLAGSIAPLEDCYCPELTPANEVLEREHSEQIKFLAELNIDFLLLETFNSIREAKIVCELAQKTQKPFVISFVINEQGNLLTGESLSNAVEIVSLFKPEAILINCVPPKTATLGVLELGKLTALPIGAYGNGDGKASDAQGWEFTGKDDVQKYANFCKEWVNLGANIIGGCCGTNPAYTKEYSKFKLQK